MRFHGGVVAAVPIPAEAIEEEPEVLEEIPADLITPGDAPSDLYDIAEPPPVPVSRIVSPTAPGATPLVTEAGPPVACPSCNKMLFPGAKICIDCGIDLKTGRSLVTSKDINEDDLAIRADTWIRIVSWIVWMGPFPIASEAFATKKPYVTWAITALTVLVSAIFFAYLIGNDNPSPAAMNLMHWTGSREVSDKHAADAVAALERMYRDEEMEDAPGGVLSEETQRRIHSEAVAEANDIHGAPEGVGFRWYQLFTHALLHGGFLHLAGNLLFLLVFGLRVNEMIGTTRMIIIYPLLAAGSAFIDGLFHLHEPLTPTIGASGAIMGLAGMYIVFFPVQRVHMAIWFRFWFWLRYKLFTMRGFWLLVLWIGFNDLLPMVFKSEDDVAHWAHLGGFVLGVVTALILLLSRQVTAGGSDLLSVTLGKRAWKLLGRPASPALTATPVAV
jgi:membrane associated rhomboid family serine protease